VIADMPRPRPPHLRLEKTRHGRRAWYVRFGNGPRIRIKADYGTPEFDAAYQAALRGETLLAMPRVPSGSLAWLIARYREVDAWRSRPPRGGNGKIFLGTSYGRRAKFHMERSQRRRSWLAEIDVLRRRARLGISLTRCAGCLRGR
jgi:hypothetical protein